MRNILATTSCFITVLLSASLCPAESRHLISSSDSDLLNTERSVMESLVLEAAPIQAKKKTISSKNSTARQKNVKESVSTTNPKTSEVKSPSVQEQKLETKLDVMKVAEVTNGAVSKVDQEQTLATKTEIKNEVVKPIVAPKKTKKIVAAKAKTVEATKIATSTAKGADSEVVKSAPVSVSPEEMIAKDTKIEALSNENAKLKLALEDSRQKIVALNAEVDSARSGLMVAETELNRLLALTPLKASTKRNSIVPELRSDSRAMIIPSSNLNPTTIETTESAMPERGAPYPVATVSLTAAELRLGPGTSYAVLTRLPEGSRVAVEMRKGEWYRVFSPAGERAWIHSGAVIFGDKVSPLNDSSSARVKGYKSSAEDRAFRELVGR